MLDANDPRDGLVIPRWLPVERALASGELNVPRDGSLIINQRTRDLFSRDYQEVLRSHNPFLAAELMGSALVIGEDAIASELALIVVGHTGLAAPARALARALVGDDSGDAARDETVAAMIRATRRDLARFQKDAFVWMQLARHYTIKGLTDKARRAVTVAVALAPTDRYIVRSAARFFIHIGELDTALHYLTRASQRVSDPWLDATRLNVSLLIGVKIRRSDRVVPRDLSVDRLLHFSELIATAGIFHLQEGSESRARDAFRLAWKNPSANVVTHGEWVIRNRLPSMEQTALDFDKSSAAKTWHAFSQLRFSEALEWSREWELDEPYSVSPFAAGSSIACLSNDAIEGVEIAQRGLSANPRSFALHNNLCYALLRAGRVDDAADELARLPEDSARTNLIYRSATTGLLRYKQGDHAGGKLLYLQAVAEANRIGETFLAMRAMLLLALAEVEHADPPDYAIVRAAMEESRRAQEPGILAVRQLIDAVLQARPGRPLS